MLFNCKLFVGASSLFLGVQSTAKYISACLINCLIDELMSVRQIRCNADPIPAYFNHRKRSVIMANVIFLCLLLQQY